MGIVNWSNEGGKDAASKIKHSEEATMFVLAMSEEQLKKRWYGRLIIKNIGGESRLNRISESVPEMKIVVELSKTAIPTDLTAFSPIDTSISIRIYDRPAREGSKLVHINWDNGEGANSWMLSEYELKEMNLAIEEGIKVYRQPDAWIALNKQKEKIVIL